MLIRHIPNLRLQADPDLRLLRLEWVARSDVRQLRNSATQLLAVLQEQPIRHLLLDMNSVPDLLPADQYWLGEHWMPALVALDLHRLVLVISSTRIHNQLAIDALHDLVKPAIRFDAQYFSDTASALDWITDGSPRQPALLAEWVAS